VIGGWRHHGDVATGACSVREAKLHRVDGAFEGNLDPGGRVAIYRTPLPALAVLRAPLAKIVGAGFAALTRLYRDGHRDGGCEWSRWVWIGVQKGPR